MADIDTNNIYSQLGLSNSQETSKKKGDELGQAEFLELMTSQLKFQDPLKPMENGDFLGQMAQFGTVSGINELNSAFSSMSASFQSNQALQASTLVGKRVLAPSDSAYLAEGKDISGSIDLKQPANRVIVSITNSAGQLVHRQDLGLQQTGLVDFSWDGVDRDGNQMPTGNYRISAELHSGTDVSAGETFAVADVESVTLGKAGQDLTLTVTGLGDIGLSQIRKIL
jgi:flagellar basal-body rod modification protein FlgD